MVTKIDDLSDEDCSSDEEILNLDILEENIVHGIRDCKDIVSYKDTLNNISMDLSIPLKNRTKAIELYNTYFELDVIELVTKISGMYMFSRTKILEEYMYELCTNSNISNNIKVILAKSLGYHGEEIGYVALNILCEELSNGLVNIATPIYIDTIKLLFKSKDYRSNALKYFIGVINNQKIECEYRYNTILSLENESDDMESLISNPEDSDDNEENKRIKDENDNIKSYNEFIIESIQQSMNAFFYTEHNNMMYRLLSSQYLFQNHTPLENDSTQHENNINTEDIEDILINIAENPDIEYNLRADATDIVLKFGKNKDRAERVIILLGNVKGKSKTIFENAQNAHYDEFVKSVNDGIDFLNTIPLLKLENGNIITFDHILKQVKDLVETIYNHKTDEDIIKKINIAMNRINMDRALYSKYNCSLAAILLKVWTYVASHECENEMKKRLLEELHDMAGICSTGFAERLINVISGFGDFNFRISFEEQIVANFSGRLTARAKNILTEWNNTDRIKMVANILINIDPELKKNVLRLYLNKIGVLDKYIFIRRGPYRKLINVFEDPVEYEKLLGKLTKDDMYPTNEQRYTAYLEYLQNEGITSKKSSKKSSVLPSSDYFILEEFRDNILSELVIDTSNAADRICFSTFLGIEMLSIREELYEEFKEHINDQEFDNYFRTAVCRFEQH